MSYVEFKKMPCHPVDFSGQGSSSPGSGQRTVGGSEVGGYKGEGLFPPLDRLIPVHLIILMLLVYSIS